MPDFVVELLPFDPVNKKPQVFRKQRGSPALQVRRESA